MPDAFSRMEMLLGDAGLINLAKQESLFSGLAEQVLLLLRRWPDVVWRALHLWIMGSCLLLTLTDSYMRCDLLLEKVMFRLPR